MAQTLAPPLGGEGHEVARGCTRVRIEMIRQSKAGRLSAVRTKMNDMPALCPVHPLPLRGFPLKGKQEIGTWKLLNHTHFITYRRFPPLVPAVPPSPKGKHVTGFSDRSALLQIQFLCHPAGGGTTTRFRPKEALIKSLSAFILEFLCNARNGTTRIASYLRSPMTKQCIKILIKADSMN